MLKKTVQYALSVLGLTGMFFVGRLLNSVAQGSGYIFGVFILLAFFLGFRKYPRIEVFAMFGLLFGGVVFAGLVPAYLLLKAEHVVLAVIWLFLLLVILILFWRKITRWLTPTFFLANEFVLVISPHIPVRETPTGCILVGGEAVLFFILLLTAQLSGPFLWVAHLLLLWIFRKRNKGKKITTAQTIGFVFLNVVVLTVLYILLDKLGFKEWMMQF